MRGSGRVRSLSRRQRGLGIALLVILAILSFAGCDAPLQDDAPARKGASASEGIASSAYLAALDDIAGFDEVPYTEVNEGAPFFTDEDVARSPFEDYASLDELGRCVQAFALVGPETMPYAERGNISEVHPTGWHSDRYTFVDGGALYNRCHLIAHSLAGEDANRENLITGTRFMNTEGMQPFEDEVLSYIRRTGNHVLYRVTPHFIGDELVARGVLMEALSLEDEGRGIEFCVYCYNVQPGVGIDYATGDNWLDEAQAAEDAAHYDMGDRTSSSASPWSGGHHSESTGHHAEHAGSDQCDYILNTNTMRFHYPNCASAASASDRNKRSFSGTREEVLDLGYEPCGECHP